ncbi:DUF1643 domain-containing protein [Roseobacter sinensis]|uniref:DUF1643 domain-containing protein n=1 Tax=Roseobacter sinensis TaxID=2931391 RepID=A0ABT3B9I7_9RHOB|nr:DUF1643 domain-containing protein [Roseobacter sp. WL0113]MCV3270247.1 DUF1643 domain-containing protein [Roseobacter sp. WL0113]
MHTRTHHADGIFSTALYSDCGCYRYSLTRVWDGTRPRVNFVMLNPSTADERRNDPTVERCERRARQLGFGAFEVTNIFAWRETDPRALRKAADPVGPENDAILVEAAKRADQVIAAWGVHGVHLARGAAVAELLSGADCVLHHLGTSKAGHPRHPLYLPYAQAPERWDLPVER